MACTYDYKTGQITFDFHIVRYGEICNLQCVQARVGGYGCLHCPFCYGTEHVPQATFYDDPLESFIRCKHPGAKDSKDSWKLKNYLCKKIETEALGAL